MNMSDATPKKTADSLLAKRFIRVDYGHVMPADEDWQLALSSGQWLQQRLMRE